MIRYDHRPIVLGIACLLATLMGAGPVTAARTHMFRPNQGMMHPMMQGMMHPMMQGMTHPMMGTSAVNFHSSQSATNSLMVTNPFLSPRTATNSLRTTNAFTFNSSQTGINPFMTPRTSTSSLRASESFTFNSSRSATNPFLTPRTTASETFTFNSSRSATSPFLTPRTTTSSLTASESVTLRSSQTGTTPFLFNTLGTGLNGTSFHSFAGNPTSFIQPGFSHVLGTWGAGHGGWGSGGGGSGGGGSGGGYGGGSGGGGYGGGGYGGGYAAPVSSYPTESLQPMYDKMYNAASNASGPAPGKTGAGPLAGLVTAQGGFDWPLALRILPPGPQASALRQQIDATAWEVQRQASAGRVDADLLREMSRDLGRLSDLLADKAGSMPVSQQAIADAGGFLQRVAEALGTGY